MIDEQEAQVRREAFAAHVRATEIMVDLTQHLLEVPGLREVQANSIRAGLSHLRAALREFKELREG